MTASEGLAFAGIILSALLGYLGYRTGREARVDARELAREARDSAADEARKARLFERRKDVYEEVLEYAYRTEDSVDRTEPLVTWKGAPGPPAWPTEDEVRRQNARTAAWGSKELLGKLIELKQATQEFQGAVFVLMSNRAAEMESGDDVKKVWTTRETVKALVEDVIELVNQELAL
jgi:hypothetical protein